MTKRENKIMEIAVEIDRLLTDGIEIHPKSPIHEKLNKALRQPAVIKSVCDHPWKELESVMGDGVLCRKCNTVIKQTDI